MEAQVVRRPFGGAALPKLRGPRIVRLQTWGLPATLKHGTFNSGRAAMALIECEECGGQVSDRAAACPHCGAPVPGDGAQSPLQAAPAVSAEDQEKLELIRRQASVERTRRDSRQRSTGDGMHGRREAKGQNGSGSWLLKILIILVVLVIAGSFLGSFLKSVIDSYQQAASDAQKVSAIKNKPEYILAASELYRAYNENEVSAKIKYGGKLVHVRGQYISNGVALGGRSYAIVAVPGNLIFSIQCFFPQSREHQIAILKEGQAVVFSGIVGGKFGNVYLEDCAVIR